MAQLAKSAGQVFTIDISFKHKGPGGDFDVGVGIAPQAFTASKVVRWLPAKVTVPSNDLSTEVKPPYTVVGKWPSDLPDGTYQILGFVRRVGLSYETITNYDSNNGFMVTHWWKNVVDQGIGVAEDEFTDLSAVFR